MLLFEVFKVYSNNLYHIIFLEFETVITWTPFLGYPVF